MLITPPLKWHGGKHYLSKRIIALMPKHTHYVEPYAGGLAVLLAKKFQGVSEVVNDLNGSLSNFWRALADDTIFAEFRRRVEAIPFSQPDWEEQAALLDCGTPLDRAVAFFVVARQSREGKSKVFATLSRNRVRRGMNEQVSSWLTAIDGLPAVHDRLKRVVILNDDAIAVIQREDSQNTFFYLDPPYLHSTRITTSDYMHEMSHTQHADLLSTLAAIEGKFVLSGYRSPLYDEVAKQEGWRRVDIRIDCKASGAKVKPTRTECLWMNYETITD